MPELTQQIHEMVENWTDEMISAYRQDCGVNAETFYTMVIIYFNEYVRNLSY